MSHPTPPPDDPGGARRPRLRRDLLPDRNPAPDAVAELARIRGQLDVLADIADALAAKLRALAGRS